MTNYIHLLGSGHISEYLYRHRNLYRHLQQGWEAFNKLLKSFFFCRTGCGGGHGGTQSKLKPIARWLQRRLLWLCGLSKVELDAFMELKRQAIASVEQDLGNNELPEAEVVEEANREINELPEAEVVEQNDDMDDEVDEFLLAMAAFQSI